MLILTENHGKEVIGVEEKDMRRAEEIFRGREPIYYSNPKMAKSHVIENWNLLFKVFPKNSLTKAPIDMYQRE